LCISEKAVYGTFQSFKSNSFYFTHWPSLFSQTSRNALVISMQNKFFAKCFQRLTAGGPGDFITFTTLLSFKKKESHGFVCLQSRRKRERTTRWDDGYEEHRERKREEKDRDKRSDKDSKDAEFKSENEPTSVVMLRGLRDEIKEDDVCIE